MPTASPLHADSKLYRLKLPGTRAAATTSLYGVAPLLAREQGGRCEIEEITTLSSFLSPTVRRWGWAIKEADGTVRLEPDDHPE